MKKPWTRVWVLIGLSMLGTFWIDADLSSFGDIGAGLHFDHEHLQHTLGIYLFTFAFMMLFYGTLRQNLPREIPRWPPQPNGEWLKTHLAETQKNKE